MEEILRYGVREEDYFFDCCSLSKAEQIASCIIQEMERVFAIEDYQKHQEILDQIAKQIPNWRSTSSFKKLVFESESWAPYKRAYQAGLQAYMPPKTKWPEETKLKAIQAAENLLAKEKVYPVEQLRERASLLIDQLEAEFGYEEYDRLHGDLANGRTKQRIQKIMRKREDRFPAFR
ncbi:hypothetical protein [Candidatus Protochlamydia phocaeensis]|uniref:hypothetical protein n=1 Tax=Candidatus Protochlamydia phocaeensis TaxID=1414722 RepID=UPI00083812FA|nr:hypothetical protein [Candidatus Protochlamydia phocaeensis]